MAAAILTVIGSDRPGLTEALAEAVLAAGGNWLESRLSRLGGLYVGSVLIDLPADRLELLRAAVREVDAKGLEVRIASPVEDTGTVGEALDLRLVGQDRPGIVRQVTAALSSLSVNIESFESHISSEAHSGAPLFHVHARLRLPPQLRQGDLRAALEAISAEIMVDVSLAPAEQA